MIQFNRGFFKLIDTESKAYWLGFIHADGCISSNRVTIKLHSKDNNHLLKFANDIDADSSRVITKTYDTPYGTCKVSYISLCSRPMVDNLISHGITLRKSWNGTYINLKNSLQHHYDRGLFDGDGSICIDKNKRVSISLTGTKNMCSGFTDSLNISKVSRDKTAYRWRTSGYKNAKAVSEYLYNDATVFMNRKKAIFDCVNEL